MAPASCVWWPLTDIRSVCIMETDLMSDSKAKGPSHIMRERWFKAVALSGNTWLGGHGCRCSCWSCSYRITEDINVEKIGFLYIAYLAACLPRLSEVMSSLLHKTNKLQRKLKVQILQRWISSKSHLSKANWNKNKKSRTWPLKRPKSRIITLSKEFQTRLRS